MFLLRVNSPRRRVVCNCFGNVPDTSAINSFNWNKQRSCFSLGTRLESVEQIAIMDTRLEQTAIMDTRLEQTAIMGTRLEQTAIMDTMLEQTAIMDTRLNSVGFDTSKPQKNHHQSWPRPKQKSSVAGPRRHGAGVSEMSGNQPWFTRKKAHGWTAPSVVLPSHCDVAYCQCNSLIFHFSC